MAHQFLSPAWFDAVHQLRAARPSASTIETAVKMNQVITDAPFSDQPILTYLDTSSGEAVLESGQLDDADVTITTDWATARALFVDQDQGAVMQAFLEGKMQIQGDLMKMLALQSSLPTDAAAHELSAAIQAITA